MLLHIKNTNNVILYCSFFDNQKKFCEALHANKYLLFMAEYRRKKMLSNYCIIETQIYIIYYIQYQN